MTDSRLSDADLLARADAIAEKAYAPYSSFHVGVAVLTRDGTVIEGVNVENAAYPLGICAEKNGIGTAITQGYGPGDFEAIAVGSAGRDRTPLDAVSSDHEDDGRAAFRPNGRAGHERRRLEGG